MPDPPLHPSLYARWFRQQIWERDNGACGICGRDVELSKMQIDHIIPRIQGGSHDWANLQTAHPLCNARKGPHRVYGRSAPRVATVPTPAGRGAAIERGAGMTVPEAAEYLQLSTETIRRMLREGRLRGSQPAGRRGGWRVRRLELDRLAAPGIERLPPPAVGAERRAAALRRLRDQAEQARQRGDDEGAERFEAIAAGMGR